MKKPLLFLALSLCTALNSAYADTYDATISGDGYQFSSSFSGSTDFDDYVYFSTEGFQEILASVSATGGQEFTFKSFNLLDEDKNLIATGNVFNAGAQVSFGYLNATGYGNYYLHIVGNNVGTTTGYNGTIITTNVVPEPESYALMLSGLGLVGLASRRKAKVTT